MRKPPSFSPPRPEPTGACMPSAGMSPAPIKVTPWTPIPSDEHLDAGRATADSPVWMAAVAGPDGRIYAIGGAQYSQFPDRATMLATVEAYTPGANTWTRLASMAEPRYGAAAAVGADGRIYVLGGSPAVAGTTLASVEAYTPSANTWAAVAPLEVARELGGAAAIGGHLYVAGGIFSRAGPHGGRGVLSDVETLNPPCTFLLGFATLHDQLPTIIGNCTDDASYNPQNGDAFQHTANGLLVWRKADNVTAFTDGYHTWINGPEGLAERLNSERFPWERGGA